MAGGAGAGRVGRARRRAGRLSGAVPTPFTHLAGAWRLLAGPELPEGTRRRLRAELPAFLLGSIAADARVHAAAARDSTHFYSYEPPMAAAPWRVMLQRHPALRRPRDEAQRIFLAGYVAHLGMDEVWTRELFWPRFRQDGWGADRRERVYALHVLLSLLDERDYPVADGGSARALAQARPAGWLPFLGDEDLLAWRDLILRQLRGSSETLAILSRRVGATAGEFRALLDDAGAQQDRLWRYVSRGQLAGVERNMLAGARGQLQAWLREQDAQSGSTALTRN